MGPTLDDIITKLEVKEGIKLQKLEISAAIVAPKSKEAKVRESTGA